MSPTNDFLLTIVLASAVVVIGFFALLAIVFVAAKVCKSIKGLMPEKGSGALDMRYWNAKKRMRQEKRGL